MVENKLYYTTEGEGNKPAVFVHGIWGGGNNLRSFDFSGLPVTPRYFPDNLGFGKSPKPNIAYTAEAHCQALAETLPNTGPLTIIGNSFGSVLAIHFAHRYPEWVSNIVLISPPIYKDIDEAKQYLSSGMFARLTIDAPVIARLGCLAYCTLSKPLLAVGAAVIPNKTTQFLYGATQHTWQSYYSTIQDGFLKEPLAPLAEQVGSVKPTLLICGEKDRYAATDTLQALQAPKMEKVFIAGATTHHLLDEQFDRCAPIMTQWLAQTR